MNLRKKIITTVAALALTASTALTGAAQNVLTATDESSVTIGGGDFTVSLSASDFGNVRYELYTQTAEGGSIILNVSDLRGNGRGWEVTLSTQDFIGETDDQQRIEVENLVVKPASLRITEAKAGSQEISEEMKAPVILEGEADQLVWTASEGNGKGSYNLYVEADLIIPGGTMAQTYTAIGTVKITSAP